MKVTSGSKSVVNQAHLVKLNNLIVPDEALDISVVYQIVFKSKAVVRG